MIQLGNANALQNSTVNENWNAGTNGLTFTGSIGTFTIGGLTGGSAPGAGARWTLCPPGPPPHR